MFRIILKIYGVFSLLNFFFLGFTHVLTDMTSEVVFILNVVISILISNSALSLMKQKAG